MGIRMQISQFFPLIGIAIFAYLILNIDIWRTLQILSQANLVLIFLTAVITVFMICLKAYKWKLIVDLYGGNYPLNESIRAWTMGFSLSMITPGRFGDLSRAYYIKARTGVGKGLTTVIIDRVIDIAILFSLAIMGFLSFVTFFTQYSNLFFLVSALFIMFIATICLSTKKKVVGFILKPVFSRIVPEKHRSALNFTFHEFYSGLDMLKKRKRRILLASAVGILVWIISIIQYYLLATAIGVDVPLLFLVSIVPIISLLDLLPVSFSGIGTRDAALILFFSFISVQKEYAISVSLLVLFFGYILVGLAGAFFMLGGSRKHYKP